MNDLDALRFALFDERRRLRARERDAKSAYGRFRAAAAPKPELEAAMRAWLGAMRELIELEIRLSLLNTPSGGHA